MRLKKRKRSSLTQGCAIKEASKGINNSTDRWGTGSEWGAEYVDVQASQTCRRSAFVQVDGIGSIPKSLNNKLDE